MIFGIRKLESWAIVRHCLRYPMFSRFDTIPECDRHTHTHTRLSSVCYAAICATNTVKIEPMELMP